MFVIHSFSTNICFFGGNFISLCLLFFTYYGKVKQMKYVLTIVQFSGSIDLMKINLKLLTFWP